MRVEKDFKELLGLFNKHNVRYCIVGSFAVAFHYKPRYTKDMDLLVEPSLENGKKIIGALQEFGFGGLEIAAEDFAKEGQIVQLGYEPVRIDLINSIPGASFAEIWEKKQVGNYDGEKVFFIGFNELVKNKRAVGRRQDLADLEKLEKKKS